MKLKTKLKTAAEVTDGFFFSEEMKNKKLSDSEFVERCYRVMMDRASDQGGKRYWADLLNEGSSRKKVVKGFIDSDEFTNVCTQYDVTKGTLELEEFRDVNEGVTAFAARCYTKALGRKYDVRGLNYWSQYILGSQDKRGSAVEAAKEFFNSEELKNMKLSDEEFITRCYLTFLDRNPDKAGLSYWKKELSKGKSLNDILNEFGQSKEFNNIMGYYGL